jgi:membrane protein DedA with SNARE-associated domain
MTQPVALPGFLHSFAPLSDHWGYPAVGLMLLAEGVGVPVPGETVLIAVGVYAGAGRLNILAVGLIGLAAVMLGDSIGYVIGRLGGRAPALRFGRCILFSAERLDKAEALFIRHGGKIVTIARFTEELRQANGVIAGIARMPWLRFLAYNALGAALWVGAWSSAGYLAGNHITTPYPQDGRHASYLPAAAVLLIVALLLRRRRTRRTAHPVPARLNVPRAGGNGQS